MVQIMRYGKGKYNMMMNPKMLMQMKSLFTRFQQNHPKVPMFFSAAAGVINEGSVIEIHLTTAEGKDLCTNMRVTPDDIEMVKAIQGMISK